MRRLILSITAAAVVLSMVASPVAARTAPPANIVDIAVAASKATAGGEFKTLVAAVLAADPAVVATLSEQRQLTVFALTDAAFAKLGLNAGNVGTLPKAALTQILLYHVAPGARYAADVVSSSQIRTLERGFLKVSVMGDSAYVNKSKIIATDITATQWRDPRHRRGPAALAPIVGRAERPASRSAPVSVAGALPRSVPGLTKRDPHVIVARATTSTGTAPPCPPSPSTTSPSCRASPTRTRSSRASAPCARDERAGGFEGEGFPVRRAFAGVDLADLDPFIHMDQMGEVEYAPGRAEGHPWHPHRGFETVTYMIDGDFEHSDSNGGGGVITNGDTQWMTAGAGILHIEKPPEALVAQGGLFHGFQLWVNLPRAQKWSPPRYQDIRAQRGRAASPPPTAARSCASSPARWPGTPARARPTRR